MCAEGMLRVCRTCAVRVQSVCKGCAERLQCLEHFSLLEMVGFAVTRPSLSSWWREIGKKSSTMPSGAQLRLNNCWSALDSSALSLVYLKFAAIKIGNEIQFQLLTNFFSYLSYSLSSSAN